MCNPDCILSRPFDENLVAQVDELTATPEFQADLEGGFDFCEALQRAIQRPQDAA
jgi:hypothetical protein